MAEADPWDEHAQWWRATFTHGADPEYQDQILPLACELLDPAPGELILDAGCGEGHLARMLAASGTRVVGCDASREQTVAAQRAGRGVSVVRSRVEALPLASGTVDSAVCVLVLEHVADLATAQAELARVLRPGGRLVVFLNHPLFQTPESGWVDDHILEEQYWRVGAYLDAATTMEEVDVGVVLPFHHRPLSTYVNGFVTAGLELDRMLEPAPPQRFLDLAPAYAQSATIPRVLVLALSCLEK